ncbi:hypothetical protein LZD49_26225 [Dyadobacter sp. CY261]|uniref:hypothetical protein n=1 Tax=Dyadobacter sp. CY261 TaxID=2907203 RepID=UPI001F248B02|nr:hypothetical protein [Dyadobacter sp. CY261]MCF0074006.1 hypothetical protein [Dyadobacter sp. CY261]
MEATVELTATQKLAIRNDKIYSEYQRLMSAGTPSYAAVKHIQQHSESIGGTFLHSYEQIYRIIKKVKAQREKEARKKRRALAAA